MPPATQSYSRYLPGIYQEIESILPQYLKPFEDQFAAFDALLAAVDTYIASGLAPTQDFLPWLAGWVALTLDEEWDEITRRRLIAQAVELYRWRGTATGLKRYLALYTKLTPDQIEIREGRWAGGMQIGIASRIGGFTPGNQSPIQIGHTTRRAPLTHHDYYVVDTVAPPGHPHVNAGERLVLYFDAADVVRVEIGPATVQLWRRGAASPSRFPLGSITRRNQLIDEVYSLQDATRPDDPPVIYRGDSLLAQDVKRPYCFVVRISIPADRYAQIVTPHWLNKVKNIIAMEKPAHTLCYLKLLKTKKTTRLAAMQIGVRSSVGLDTTVI